MFSYRIQVYCAAMVYSDESTTLGDFKMFICLFSLRANSTVNAEERKEEESSLSLLRTDCTVCTQALSIWKGRTA